MQVKLSWEEPLTGEKQEHIFSLPIALGRNPEDVLNDRQKQEYSIVRLNSKQVSRLHAFITFVNGQIVLEDQSSNGTVVNDELVVQSSFNLANRNVLQIGLYRITVNNLSVESDTIEVISAVEANETEVLDNPTITFSNPTIKLSYKDKNLTFELTHNSHFLGREVQESDPGRLQVPEDWTVISRYQACFHKVGDNYYIYDGDGEHPSKNGLFINNKLITSKEGYCLQSEDEIQIGQNPQKRVTIKYINPNVPTTAINPKQQSVSLNKETIVLGRSHNADLELDAPTVSRRHAVITRNTQGHLILHNCSANGLFLNKQKVSGTATLSPGDIIQIGPYTLILQGDKLVLVDKGNNIRLDAQNIVRVVLTKNKQKRRLLDDISASIEPGQLVAIVGGSGAGKSTLMKSLLGIESITSGNVYLNGDNLKNNFNIYRNLIGYVPQDDIVHTNLTVKEILYYAAKLRLSTDINIEAVIEKLSSKLNYPNTRIP
ncbi:MAG: FHA domain-containing protein [Richelia sp. RM2_1_2]|nr:FHA domain-containing protein [Richelia sp. RM2_1_2]